MLPFRTNAPETNWVEITDLEARNNSRRFARKARELAKRPTLWQRIVAWLNESI